MLTGPRQIGKTSVLQHHFTDLRQVSLDLPAMAEMAESRPDAFLSEHPPPVLIDKSGHEVDLVIDVDGALCAIECKTSEHPTRKDTGGIVKLREFYGERAVAESVIAYPGEATYTIEGGVTARPGWASWES